MIERVIVIGKKLSHFSYFAIRNSVEISYQRRSKVIINFFLVTDNITAVGGAVDEKRGWLPSVVIQPGSL